MSPYTRPLHPTRIRSGVATLDGRRLVEVYLPICLIALLAMLVMTYIAFMNSMTRKTFEMRKLSNLLTEQRQDNERLALEQARQESIANLADRVSTLGMVQTNKVEYVNAVSGAVAMR